MIVVSKIKMNIEQEITLLKTQIKSLNRTLKALCSKVVDLEKNTSQSKSTSKTCDKVAPKEVTKSEQVTITREIDEWIITGKTFNLRAVLKKYGGKWDGDSKHWTIPNNTVEYESLVSEINETGVDVKQFKSEKKPQRSRPQPSKKPVRLSVTKLDREETVKSEKGYLMSDSDSD